MSAGRSKCVRVNAISVPTSQVPELDELLLNRDYTGAIAILEYKIKNGEEPIVSNLWLGYCYFRLGEYRKASELYLSMLQIPDCPPEVNSYLGCCYFYMGMYMEAKDAGEKDEKNPLQNRLLFQVAHRASIEKKLLQHHAQLKDSLEDQLCLASVHYTRGHLQDAVEIFKRILAGHKNFIALNVYLAMCYYKMDYYDVAIEVLNVYLRQHADSAAATNLNACCRYRLFSRAVAEAELSTLDGYDLYPVARDIIRHNKVVFRDGDGALQTWVELIDAVPEARANLILFHLRRGEVAEAVAYAEDLAGNQPFEWFTKALAFVFMAQKRSTPKAHEYFKNAADLFHAYGEGGMERDTIQGRQALAMEAFIKKEWDHVVTVLNTCKEYCMSDDTFHFIFGQAKAMQKQFAEGEAALLLVQGDIKRLPQYTQFLAFCYVWNAKPQLAWDLYKRTKDPAESLALLKTIAHQTYAAKRFFYAFIAFDELEKADPSPENWNGKLGAIGGLFKQLAHGDATREQMAEALSVLAQGHHPQIDQVVAIIRRWARENGIHL